MSLPVPESGIKTQRRRSTDDDDSCLRERRGKKETNERGEYFFSGATTCSFLSAGRELFSKSSASSQSAERVKVRASCLYTKHQCHFVHFCSSAALILHRSVSTFYCDGQAQLTLEAEAVWTYCMLASSFSVTQQQLRNMNSRAGCGDCCTIV